MTKDEETALLHRMQRDGQIYLGSMEGIEIPKQNMYLLIESIASLCAADIRRAAKSGNFDNREVIWSIEFFDSRLFAYAYPGISKEYILNKLIS